RDAEKADTGPAVGSKIGCPVLGVDVKGPDADHEEYRDHLDGHHESVETGALLNPFYEHCRYQSHNQDGHQVYQGALSILDLGLDGRIVNRADYQNVSPLFQRIGVCARALRANPIDSLRRPKASVRPF